MFSCSGGVSEGFRRAGLPVDVAFDADPDACTSYEVNLGHAPILCDVRELLEAPADAWPEIDLLLADPPCTPWSRAGKRLGLKDERDMLVATERIILRARPRCFLIGNVPGLDDSEPWERVVQPMCARFNAAGWHVDYARLNAADYGVPQHRLRPWWFGHKIGTHCIRWSLPTHGDGSTLRLDGCKPYVTCRDALGHLPPEELGTPVQLIRQDRPDGRSAADKRNGSRMGAPQYILTDTQHPHSDADEPSRTVRAGDGGGARRTVSWPPRSWHGGGARRALAIDGAALVTRRLNPKHRPSEPDEPAATIAATSETVMAGPHRGAALAWPWDRPSTTIVGRDSLAPPGHHERWPWNRPATTVRAQIDEFAPANENAGQYGPNAIKLSEKAAAILQGFDESWRFIGATKKSRWSQLGMATPPPLAEAIARAVKEWFARNSVDECDRVRVVSAPR